MSVEQLAIATAIAVAASALQGAVGFGFALVAAPTLLLVDMRMVPGPVTAAALVLTLLTALRDRSGIAYQDIGWTTLGRLPGTALGALAVGAIPAAAMGPPVGAIVLLAVALSLSGLQLRPRPWTLLGAGGLSGFMGTVSSIGGPPMAMVYQHEPGQRLRGTLAGTFVIGCVVTLAALAMVGRFGAEEAGLGAMLLPGVVTGFSLSGRAARFLDGGYTRPAVLAVSAAAAVIVIARELL